MNATKKWCKPLKIFSLQSDTIVKITVNKRLQEDNLLQLSTQELNLLVEEQIGKVALITLNKILSFW